MKIGLVAIALAMGVLAGCSKNADGDMVVKSPRMETHTDTVKMPSMEVTQGHHSDDHAHRRREEGDEHRGGAARLGDAKALIRRSVARAAIIVAPHAAAYISVVPGPEGSSPSNSVRTER